MSARASKPIGSRKGTAPDVEPQPRSAWPRFADIRYQDRAISIFRRALASDRLHHALLLDGPDGVGKEMAARALAARLLCLGRAADAEVDAGGFFGGAAPEPSDDPLDACGRCDSCRILAAGTHPDFHFVERGLHKHHPDRSIRISKGLFLVVDVVRHYLIEPLANRPNLSPRRVCIVRDAERMNEEAQNALLKTLEEPPGATCLILVSSSPSRLLSTIRSRCQRVAFAPLPTAFVTQQLEAAGCGPAASSLASMAQGRLGAALAWRQAGLMTSLDDVASALSDGLPRTPEPFAKRLIEQAESLAARIAGKAADSEPDEASEDSDEESEADAPPRKSRGGSGDTDALRGALQLVLLTLSALYRDALSVRVSPALASLNLHEAAVRRLASMPEERLTDGLTSVTSCETMIGRNVSPQLALEWLAISLTGQRAEAV